ncbi:hypothetical protein JCM18750_08320 [Halostagnicola bangensis]
MAKAQKEQLTIRMQEENERHRSDYFLQRKVDALMEFYSIVEKTRHHYKRQADRVGYDELSKEDYLEVIDYFDEFRVAKDKAMIFLDSDQQNTILELYDLLYDVNYNLDQGVKNPNSAERYDFQDHGLSEFNDRFDSVEDVLQAEIKKPIDAIEDN